jgi:hypothetical protein
MLTAPDITMAHSAIRMPAKSHKRFMSLTPRLKMDRMFQTFAVDTRSLHERASRKSVTGSKLRSKTPIFFGRS